MLVSHTSVLKVLLLSVQCVCVACEFKVWYELYLLFHFDCLSQKNVKKYEFKVWHELYFLSQLDCLYQKM